MSVQETLRRHDAEPDVAHAMARLVIDPCGAPVGMLLRPMAPSHMRWHGSLVLTDEDMAHPRPVRSLKRVVLKPQIVLAQEDDGVVTGHIWRVDSGDISVLMAQPPEVFQSLARYFGSPNGGA
jgi:hypothetical protein